MTTQKSVLNDFVQDRTRSPYANNVYMSLQGYLANPCSHDYLYDCVHNYLYEFVRVIKTIMRTLNVI